ncbi:hypothetical protein OSB04_008086 [Centaurea solstitialis]|uniref:Reverse transcriptase Ty1/copia-type domain-containing protein n=1 Tax=Centaurea solstitialis TaxID=347529 RepID=A0AA38WTN5_9ASTR|nr:hypothetical protein OSB04_008086 [Centaurea solstitialis]
MNKTKKLLEKDDFLYFIKVVGDALLSAGIFINQAKYIKDILKKYNLENAKIMKTPMSPSCALDSDPDGTLFCLELCTSIVSDSKLLSGTFRKEKDEVEAPEFASSVSMEKVGKDGVTVLRILGYGLKKKLLDVV